MSKKTVIAVFALLAVAGALALRPKWHQLRAAYSYDEYLRDFSKDAGVKKASADYAMRKSIFEKELKSVMAFNQDKTQTYKRGINHMSDWTDAEKARVRGHRPAMRAKSQTKPERVHAMSGLPNQKSVDYRTAFPAILTAVKDQGQCGSCWAHSATESIETAWAIATNELFVLSQEQAASCTSNPNDCGGSGGCNGGIYELAIDSVVAAGGMTQEWMYPYTDYAGKNSKCLFNASITKPMVKVSGWTQVPHNDHAALQDALATAGPLSIQVDASTWGSYESGVFTGCPYAKNISMDHAIQAIGYGHDASVGLDYWLVRNSWSPAWGENGYMRLHKTKGDDNCGWNVDPQNGSGCKGDTTPYRVCGICGIESDAIYVNAYTGPPN